ncbi:hypothetical protein K438DRAFT_1875818 [Mycena galopus ATCC 62051]|nr:hypothetical protein K438DRAFT_1875818 [Mycena galopus ATCC 62051]
MGATVSRETSGSWCGRWGRRCPGKRADLGAARGIEGEAQTMWGGHEDEVEARTGEVGGGGRVSKDARVIPTTTGLCWCDSYGRRWHGAFEEKRDAPRGPLGGTVERGARGRRRQKSRLKEQVQPRAETGRSVMWSEEGEGVTGGEARARPGDVSVRLSHISRKNPSRSGGDRGRVYDETRVNGRVRRAGWLVDGDGLRKERRC